MFLIKKSSEQNLKKDFLKSIWNINVKVKREERYPNLQNLGLTLGSMLGSAYICESSFSNMKFIKSKYRYSLSDKSLTQLLRLSTTNIKVNIDALLVHQIWCLLTCCDSSSQWDVVCNSLLSFFFKGEMQLCSAFLREIVAKLALNAKNKNGQVLYLQQNLF